MSRTLSFGLSSRWCRRVCWHAYPPPAQTAGSLHHGIGFTAMRASRMRFFQRHVVGVPLNQQRKKIRPGHPQSLPVLIHLAMMIFGQRDTDRRTHLAAKSRRWTGHAFSALGNRRWNHSNPLTTALRAFARRRRGKAVMVTIEVECRRTFPNSGTRIGNTRAISARLAWLVDIRLELPIASSH